LYAPIQSTMGFGANWGVKCLIYGGPGAGKTRLASTAPAPLILSAEQGLLTLATLNLPFWQIKTVADLQQVHYWLRSSQEAAQFQTLFVDSGSDIAEVILTNEKKNSKDPRKAYGEVLDQTIALIRDFRDTPGKHVVVLAKQEHQKDEMTGVMVYGPSFPGTKLGQQMPYFFDEVFQIARYVDKASNQAYHMMLTRPTAQFVAKDRSGRLDEYEPADLNYVFGKILHQ
jgi:hypothetical protein